MPKQGGGKIRFATLNFSKWGGRLSPSSFTYEVILVKFELQTNTEHLSSCRSEKKVDLHII